VFIGGDIAPKAQHKTKRNQYYKAMEAEQREWLTTKWPEEIRPLSENGIACYVILGNGDVASNYDIHLQHEENKLYTNVNCKRVPLTEEFDLVGYPYVPFSYSSMKDFEKRDMVRCPKKWEREFRERSVHGQHDHYDRSMKLMTNFTKEDFSEKQCGWGTVDYQKDLSSIQDDLQSPVFTENAKKTVYLTHSPPYDTFADIVPRKYHVGSVAIAAFIHDYHPYLTLHGHIHETVDMSGKFIDKVSDSIVIASGNDPLYNNTEYAIGSSVILIEFDLYNPLKTSRRITLS